MNTAVTDRCDDDPGGIPTGPERHRVWGDPTDTWVSARRIWNQQAYHVTNVTEGGGIPAHEPESWKPWNGRIYNTYRSQPRSYGVAPDLRVVAASGVVARRGLRLAERQHRHRASRSRTRATCASAPAWRVRFYGTWDDDEEALLDDERRSARGRAAAEPRAGQEHRALRALRAGRTTAASALPDEVRVVVDPVSDERPDGAERECREDNNELEVLVEPGNARADLRRQLGARHCGRARPPRSRRTVQQRGHRGRATASSCATTPATRARAAACCTSSASTGPLAPRRGR